VLTGERLFRFNIILGLDDANINLESWVPVNFPN